MAIALRNPNTIMISDSSTYTPVGASDGSAVIAHRAGSAIIPGMTIELYDVSGELKWRPTASATELAERCIALDKPDMTGNTGIEDAYVTNEDVQAAYLHRGAVFNGIILSGETVNGATLIAPDGTGKLIAAGTTTEAAGIAWMKSLQYHGTVAVDTRGLIAVIS